MAAQMQLVVIILLIIGIILTLFSFINSKTPVESNSNEIKEYNILEINKSIESGKALIRNMNELYATIMKEFDEKHKELLFIYDIIDNKEKALNTNKSINKENKEINNIKETKEELYKKEEKNINNKIINLHKKGKTINDIAKSLNMGHGEVKLIIDLDNYKK